ncbi:proximal sequence element A Pbp95 isoform X2 [Oratosquilla oratoria]|uniref:proximal sequence element A Pbp95 isoform X2 n=1 Tax=Oratosquilla oratoria TaxID=337810 RepID=UPI003F75D8A8
MEETDGKNDYEASTSKQVEVRNPKDEPASPGEVYDMEPNYSGEMEYTELQRAVCYSEELNRMSDISSGPGPASEGDLSRLARKDQQHGCNQEMRILSHTPSSQTTKTDVDEGHMFVDMNEITSLPETVESLLKVNRILQRQMSIKLDVLYRKLKENLEKQEHIAEEIEEQRQILGKDSGQNCPVSGQYVLRVTSFAVPYFKDRSHNAPPLNEDAKLKIDRGCTDLHTTRLRPWSVVEREMLLEGVLKECKDQILNFWNTKVRDLERSKKKAEEKNEIMEEYDREIANCNKEIVLVEAADQKSLAFSRGVDLDWLKVSAQTFDGLRSPEECRAQWHNYVHPSINKEPWTEEEDVKIKLMVEEYNDPRPNWLDIATGLNTGRTAFQVMQRWVSYIYQTLEPANWDADNTQKLIDTVNMLRIGNYIPWPQVQQHLMGFSRAQLQSRWRVINPEMCKGPFTVEEDFLLIKGLYKFGLNFDLISHFMPGRDRVQVRMRYKRTIFPGLTTRVWQRKEDDILIRHGKVGPYKWKQLKEQLTERDPCEIRCRYHTIHVWQTLMGTNMMIPTLFPLVVTTDPDLIEEVRRRLMEEGPGLKEYIDEVRESADIQKAVKDLEKTRLAIKERKSDQTLRRLGRAINRRGRKRFTQPVQSWPDRLLTEYFLPSRNMPSLPSIEGDEEAAKSIRVLSSCLHLHILKTCSAAERRTVKDMSLFNDTDLDLIPSLLVQHNHPEYMQGQNCPVCQRKSPASIPMMPPNQTTAGALMSLLLHRPKLEEISQQDFVVLKLPPEELRTLGSNTRIYNKLFRKHCMPEEDYSQSSEDQTEEVCHRGMNTEHIKTQDSENDVVMWNDSITDTPVQIQVDFGANAQIETDDKSKIHIKIQNLKEMKKKNKEQQAAKRKKKSPTKPVRESVPCSSKTEGQVSNPGSSAADSFGLFRTPNINPGSSKQRSDVIARQKQEDKLLFHRFLALFFWPSLMTVTGPNEGKLKDMERKVQEIKKECQKESRAARVPNSSVKYKGSILPTLKIEEQEKLIETMEKNRIQYREKLSGRRKMAAKRKRGQDSNTEVSCAPGTSKASEGSGVVDDQRVSAPKEAAAKKKTAKSSKTATEGDKMSAGAAEGSEPTEIPTNESSGSGAQLYNKRKRIISLKRSLVMKKVWDARRTGTLPMRTNDRRTRRYEPKPSRTRDSRRLEMFQPKREKAKPWNLPPDGPMRVQPVVEVLPPDGPMSPTGGRSNSR